MTTEDIRKYRILILDFGSQYTQLIARCVRAIGVYCELWNHESAEEIIYQFKPNGIILSGSPESITLLNSPTVPKYIFDIGIPILGICYGMHIIVKQLGGEVKTSKNREFGFAQVEIIKQNILVQNIKDDINSSGRNLLDVWMSHNDKVTIIPENFIVIAKTKSCPFAIIADEGKKIYGIQFHPEVTHTKKGLQILKQFVRSICGCKTRWNPSKIVEDTINRLNKQVGCDKVIMGLSGGIDSVTTAMLLHQAIGKNLICIFVDNGLLRLNEATQVMNMLRNQLNLNILHISVEERFLQALIGVTDPEEKRKIIGRMFIEVFEEEASKIVGVKWLAQGTIYPDIIESAILNNKPISKSHVIKSHHNVGGLPKKMKLRLIEPLKYLFKDEVRNIGLKLGLSYEIMHRHPFPGPGISVRILGEVKKEYCDLLRHADAIFIEELYKANLYDEVSQAFVVFLPVRSVGVMGDSRKYDWVVSLRAVTTRDFMTAHWAHLPHEFLGNVSNRIINEVRGISRVVYDISGKPPSTIEWE